MHINDVRTILRKRLKREPTFDDIADALCEPQIREMQKELETLERLRKTKPPSRK